ncbi:unnamed protein product [Vitrella brassicaformis CCMP3155]|uniref:Uncharacterized protein n=1 Tax=Vitrella brassicaformis (strain CCMP3155) TaxID=1169540 RepID=A0A0G4FSR7_VITBC|nr:unnamed protein product [Vitrella brassicaformis CCMP3155]|eukprot:CEM17486.1 unnamed protein product [Vitrella brassicaformis CCMP3155]
MEDELSLQEVYYLEKKTRATARHYSEQSELRKFRRLKSAMDVLTASKEFVEVERIKQLLMWPEPGKSPQERTHPRGSIYSECNQKWRQQGLSGMDKPFGANPFDHSRWVDYQWMDAELLCDRLQRQRLKQSTRDLLQQKNVNCLLTSAWRRG